MFLVPCKSCTCWNASDVCVVMHAYLRDMNKSCRICGANPSKSSTMMTTGGRGVLVDPPSSSFFCFL